MSLNAINLMKNKPLIILVVLIVLFVTDTQAQHRRYRIQNGFSLGGGVSYFNIKTDNFTTTRGNGFIATMYSTVELPHKWYNASFGMQISENKFEVSGRMTDDVAGNEAIEYKLMTVQMGFLMHAKIIDDLLTIDVEPQLQYNGDLNFTNSQQESYFVNGYDALRAEDITTLSNFNFNGTIGITAGIGPVKVKAQYVYGFLNMLEKINKNLDLSSTFKGNPEMIAFSAMFTF